MNNTDLKRIFEDAYGSDPVFKEAMQGMSELFIIPLIKALKNGENTDAHQDRLKQLFHCIGRTYNPEYPEYLK
jgi:hypothetical protein